MSELAVLDRALKCAEGNAMEAVGRRADAVSIASALVVFAAVAERSGKQTDRLASELIALCSVTVETSK